MVTLAPIMHMVKRTTLLASGLWLGLVACDRSEPRSAVLPPPQPEVKVAVVPVEEGETIEAAVRDPDPWARARRLATLLPGLGPEAEGEIQATLENPMLALGGAELELLLRAWANLEPEAAARWAVEQSPPAYRTPAVLVTFAIWAQKDPMAAKHAADTWSMGGSAELGNAARIALTQGWYLADPAGLEQFVQSLGLGMTRQRALSVLAKVIIRMDGPEAAIRWAESLPDDDPSYKLGVFRQVTSALALLDLDLALRFCEVHCDGPYGLDLRSMISRRWVTHDGRAALDWLESAPEGHSKDLARRVTFLRWLHLDRQAATAWLAARAADGELAEWRQTIYPAFARQIAQQAPQEAIEWAEQIEQDAPRTSTLVDVARIWRAVDHDAAETWLLSSPLSDEDRAKVRMIGGGAPAAGPAPALEAGEGEEEG